MQRDASTGSGTGIGSGSTDEDSGLHDIRELARNTKQRVSSRKITIPPTPARDSGELLASSSGAWKAVALPNLANLKGLEPLKEAPMGSTTIRAEPRAARGTVAPTSAAVAVVVPRRTSRVALYAALGVVVAGITGGAIFAITRSNDVAAPAPVTVVVPTPVPVVAPAPIVAPAPVVTPAPVPAVQTIEAAPAVAPAPQAAVVDPTPDPAPAVAPAPVAALAAVAPAKKSHAVAKASPAPAPVATPAPAPVVAAAVEPRHADPKPAAKQAGGEQSVDDLLKEAGGADMPKASTPRLDKKDLTSSDIKGAMGAVAAKAQGCYKGTEGNVGVKVRVQPTGKVSNVTVTGSFAGTPSGACVAAAASAAQFPAWDGAPMTISYSYLLSE